jgi:hypothetical protein
MDEPENFLAVPLKIKGLDSQISMEAIPGVLRDIWSEAYLPAHIFEKFGVSQPSWFLIQADNENPNDDNPKQKMFSNIAHHVCLGYI